MAFIEWKDVYDVGFKEIDDQHKVLITILNELYDAQKKGTGQHMIANTLKKLAEYTIYHFDTEKKLFEQYKYPQMAEHLEEHDYFVNQVKDFQDELQRSNLLLSMKTMDFLKDWTITHILGSDKTFGEFVQRKELGI